MAVEGLCASGGPTRTCSRGPFLSLPRERPPRALGSLFRPSTALLTMMFFVTFIAWWRDMLHASSQRLEEKTGPPTPPPRKAGGMAPVATPRTLAARAGERAEGTFAVVNKLQLPVAAVVETAGE